MEVQELVDHLELLDQAEHREIKVIKVVYYMYVLEQSTHLLQENGQLCKMKLLSLG
jgi:hypothetical protein